ncbi:MAG: tetratricopeptide repeat protein [Ignavibacteriales bacterium]|nr:tetratricopeptide repeat protein [Ignavibacteriales bacterium]
MRDFIAEFLTGFSAAFGVFWIYLRIRKKRGQSLKRIFYKTIVWALICGTIYALILLSNDGRVNQLRVLPADKAKLFTELAQGELQCSGSDSELCVLIANFKGSFLNKESQLQSGVIMRLIYSQLITLLCSSLSPPNIRLDTISYQIWPHIDSHDEAREIGQSRGANIVIWGDISIQPFSPVTINPRITIIHQELNAPSEIDLDGLYVSWSPIQHLDFFSEDINQPVSLANFIIGLAYLAKKDWNRGSEFFQQGINLSGRGKGADVLYYFLAHALTEKNYPYGPESLDAMAAINALHVAIEINPSQKNYYNDLGLLYDVQNCIDEAQRRFNQALSLDSSFVIALNNLAITYYEQGNDSLAISIWNRCIRLDSSTSGPYINLGKSYYYAGDTSSAIRILIQAPTNSPNASMILNNIGAIFTAMHRTRQAITYLEKAIQLAPNSGEVYSNLGVAFQQQGEYKKALTNYQKALSVKPNMGFVYYNIAFLFARQGLTEDAVAILEEHFHEIMKNYEQLGNHSAFEFLSHDSDFDLIRKHSRFRLFLQKHTDILK